MEISIVNAYVHLFVTLPPNLLGRIKKKNCFMTLGTKGVREQDYFSLCPKWPSGVVKRSTDL